MPMFASITRERASGLRLFPQRHREQPVAHPTGQPVHVVLSKSQRAYSVFLPAEDHVFPLFQVILVLSDPKDRSTSPLETPVNLKDTFERLSDVQRDEEDESVIDSFNNEFMLTDFVLPARSHPKYYTVSEESLRKAGVELSSPAGLHFSISGSHARAVTRQIRLQRHFSEVYKGGPRLQTLIWSHARLVFRRILIELDGDDNLPSNPLDRGLIAVVTTRMVSTIGVSNLTETETFAGASAGDGFGTVEGTAGLTVRERIQEDYKDDHGVTGLHFIVFPIECTEHNKWIIYGGIIVCNSDMNESTSENTRNRSRFYRAQKWVLREGELKPGSDSTTVQRSHSLHLRSVSPSAQIPSVFSGGMNNNDDSDREASCPHIDVSLPNAPETWVEVDIRPFLNEFALGQCRLASYYRRTASGDSKKLTHAVRLLRSAIGKFCFESTVRALYDLSGCYLHGLGVNSDIGIAKLLRYCARGLRQKYDSRAIWISRLALEVAYYPGLAIERRIVSLMLFTSQTLVSLTCVRDMSKLVRLRQNEAEPVYVQPRKAKDPCENAIQDGCDADSMYSLALLYHKGEEGVAADAVRAKELYEEAIKEGRHAEAMNNLGALLLQGAEGVAADAVRAKELFEEAIRVGRIFQAMNNLGALLLQGAEGVAADAVRAKELYEEAIQEGCGASSMSNLASLLHRGAEGVAVNAVRAKELYELAIKEELDVNAMYGLATLLHLGSEGVAVDAVRAKELYEEAVKEARHVDAMYSLALLLLRGTEGVPSNVVRAKELLEKVVEERRYAEAMNDLAVLLHHGPEGIAVDAVRAKELLEESIKQGGFVLSMRNLAFLLQKGAEGVAVDAIRAKELYETAIQKGRDVPSMYNLAVMLDNGAEGVPVDAIRAKELFENAIEEGHHVHSMYNLAEMLHSGAEGVGVDKVRANKLYENALEEEHRIYGTQGMR